MLSKPAGLRPSRSITPGGTEELAAGIEGPELCEEYEDAGLSAPPFPPKDPDGLDPREWCESAELGDLMPTAGNAGMTAAAAPGEPARLLSRVLMSWSFLIISSRLSPGGGSRVKNWTRAAFEYLNRSSYAFCTDSAVTWGPAA